MWVAKQFSPSNVRLISGYDELLLRMYIIGKLNIAADPGTRYFHVGEGGWEVVTRNGVYVYFLYPRQRAAIQNWKNISRNWEVAI